MDFLKRYGIVLIFLMITGMTSTPAAGQGSWMGVYLDEGRSIICADGEVVYQVEIWIYAKVDEDKGFKSWGFDLSLPSNLDMQSWISHPDVIPVYCDPKFGCPPGESGAFNSCQTGWVWIRSGTFNVTSSDPATVEIIPHPESGVISLVGCSGTVYHPTILSIGHINYDLSSPVCTSTVPVTDCSWGVVKTIYRD